MKVRFHPEAVSELNNAVDYYEEQETGLGIDFIKEIQKGIAMISKYPDSWQQVSASTRRYLVKKFPFGLIYMRSEKIIYIIAVMHLNRKPGYWKTRQ